MKAAWLVLSGMLLVGCKDKLDPRYKVEATQVEDTATGLTWMRTPGPGAMPLGAAKAWCDAEGWRLPKTSELLTIVKPVRILQVLNGKPAIDVVAFPNTPHQAFWSLPEDGNVPTDPRVKVSAIDFHDGSGTSLVTPGEAYLFRCVR